MLISPLSGSTLSDPNSDFVIAEWTQEGATNGERLLVAPYHIHHMCDEAWYVLEGTLCVQVGEEVVTAIAGSAVMVPKGTKHSYWNPDPEPAKYLLVMTQKTYRLIQAIHATEDRALESMKKLFEKFDAELIGF